MLPLHEGTASPDPSLLRVMTYTWGVQEEQHEPRQGASAQDTRGDVSRSFRVEAVVPVACLHSSCSLQGPKHMLSIPPDQRPSLRRQQALPAVTSCSAACCNPSYTQRALTGPSTLYARKGSALQLPGALQLQPCACPTQQCRTCMAKTSNHSHLRSTRMQAWVGGEEPPATQYFATDFDWHDLRNDPGETSP